MKYIKINDLIRSVFLPLKKSFHIQGHDVEDNSKFGFSFYMPKEKETDNSIELDFYVCNKKDATHFYEKIEKRIVYFLNSDNKVLDLTSACERIDKERREDETKENKS